MINMLAEYIKKKEEQLFSKVKALEKKQQESFLKQGKTYKFNHNIYAKIQNEHARMRQSKTFKILSILKHFCANYDDEDDDGPINWLQNNLSIYVIGFQRDADKENQVKQYIKLSNQIVSKDHISIEKRIDKLIFFMKTMDMNDLDGFIKMEKLKAACGSKCMQKCMRKGLFNREQWFSTSNFCDAIIPEFPDNPKECADMVLKEIVAVWP